MQGAVPVGRFSRVRGAVRAALLGRPSDCSVRAKRLAGINRSVTAALVLAAAASSLYACGGASKETAKTAAGTRSRGSEASIERFGSEAEGAEREAVLRAERGYLMALAGGNAPRACSYLSTAVRLSLKEFARPSQEAECSRILPDVISAAAPASARQQAAGKVRRVRIDGGRAFVLFRAPGARLYVFTLRREESGWKVTTLLASILIPSPATLEPG